MFIFFVNKPITIVPYLLGLFLCIFIGSFGIEPFVMPIFNIINFSYWYTGLLIRYYILCGEETIIFNVNLNKFKGIFNFFLILNVFVFALLNVQFIRYPGIVLIWGIGLFFFTCISLSIFQKILEAKLISAGIKSNSSIKDIRFDDLYKEMREVALKKLIESKSEY